MSFLFGKKKKGADSNPSSPTSGGGDTSLNDATLVASDAAAADAPEGDAPVVAELDENATPEEKAAAAAAAAAAAEGGLLSLSKETREKVRKLSFQMADGDGQDRAQAMEFIKGMTQDQARTVMQAFAVQLDTPNALIRAIACRVMANMGNLGAPHVVKIAELVLDKDEELRRAAANALGALGKPGIDALVRLRTHENAKVREIVVYELGASKITQHAAEVSGMLGDDDVSVRGNAINALLKMGEEGFVYTEKVASCLADKEKEVSRMAEGMIIQSIRGNPKRAAALLKHPDGSARLLAVKALNQAGEEGLKHIVDIAKLIGDENEKVDTVATDMTTRAIKGSSAITIKMLTHPTSGARRLATDAVVDMGKEGAEHAEVIVQMLADAHPKTRLSAVIALGKMGEKGAAHAGEVARLVKDTDEKVRAATVEALSEMGDAGKNHASEIINLLGDPAAAVKLAAAQALKKWAAANTERIQAEEKDKKK